ncbi:hypothetical protein ACFE04_001104 [Oxalis oulophora]
MHVNDRDKKGEEIRRPWLSSTSFTPPVPIPQMNFQENPANPLYWFGSENFSSDYAQQNQAEKIIPFSGSTSESTGDWEAAVVGQLGATGYNPKVFRDLIMDAAVGVQNVSQEERIALANAVPAKSTTSRLNDGGPNILGSSPLSLDSASTSVVGVPVKYISDVSEISGHCPYDLNIPFEMTGEDSNVKSIFEFAPITPNKPITSKSNETLNLQAAILNQDKDKPEKNEADHIGKDISNCASNADLSSTVQANENCDDGGSQPIELNNVTPERKPRRRKHRPKVITTDGKAKKTPKPVTPEPAGSEAQKPTVKRKYARKRPVIKTPTSCSPLAETEEAVEKQFGSNEKLSRRRLDFDMEEEYEGENSKFSSKSSIHYSKRKVNIEKENNREDKDQQTADREEHSPVESEKQKDLDSIIRSEKQAPSTPLPTKPRPNRRGRRKTVDSGKFNTEGKSVNLEQITNIQNGTVQLTIPSVSDSPSKDSNTGGRGQGEKRKINDAAMQQTEADSSNISGYHYNSLHAYQYHMISWTPLICKKRRSEKVQVSSSGSTLSASKSNNWVFPPQLGDFTAPSNFEEGRANLEDLIQTARSTKKRTRAPTRVRDLSSLSGFADCRMKQTLSSGQNSETHNVCVEALTAELRATLTKKKRTKKTYSLSNSAFSGANKLHWNHFSMNSMGAPPEEIWKQFSIDEMTERFMHLDINRENRLFFDHEQNALVPYFMGDNGQKALVLYGQDGTIVPFNLLRKRKPRPKVDLDDETNRVWKLLLADINSEGIDGTDEDKTKWWEEERSVFQGRADSFIARMRLVQGDRRFSEWKGSVLDSVIGVFLTQNVSDHLSSSAFMALASHFPLKSRGINKEFGEGTSSVVDEQAMTLFNSEDITANWKMFSQSFCDQGSVTTQDSEHNEEKRTVISNESPESSNGAASPIFESQSKQLSSSSKEINEAGIECSSCDSSKWQTPFLKLLELAESSSLPVIYNELRDETQIDELCNNKQKAENSDGHETASEISIMNSNYGWNVTPTSGVPEINYSNISKDEIRSSDREDVSVTEQSVLTTESVSQNTSQSKPNVTIPEAPLSGESCINIQQKENTDFSEVIEVTESNSEFNDQVNTPQKKMVSVTDEIKLMKAAAAKAKAKAKRVGRELKDDFDWEKIRRETEEVNGKREMNKNRMDSLDWEAVRLANVNEIANTIKERGMNNVLAERIKEFLNRLVREHGSTDLEWLRDIPPDQAKEFLLSIRGLGLKSVECVRLLTLHHLAFPVDTNVGRIAVRLGWVPLQPLPESLQLHLLELYPVLESIQRYLWPRLCKLDQKTLYELHYHLITFGKVFCTKSKPNCNACPLRGECRHFASAFASARLALPGPEEKRIVTALDSSAKQTNFSPVVNEPPLSLTHASQQVEGNQNQVANHPVEKYGINRSCEPIIEVPLSPEPEPQPEPEQFLEHDIEDAFYEDPDEIPTIKLNMEEFTQNLQDYMQRNMELQEGEVSKALVALNIEAASIPTPKLKNVSQLRTEHHVYELPDNHPLLKGLDKRETDDPCSYLLAIWTPGETASSIEPPESKCSAQEHGKLCDDQTCFSCNSVKEANSNTVRGTLLIPCRTAMRGSFPLNGTYFQVNEVFADHESSLKPMDVPRTWLWNLPRRTVYFGTSIPSIFKGLSTEAIQHCFWRGFVCVRGFDQKTRAPRPLMARLHFPASRMKSRARTGANDNQMNP